MEEKKSRAGGKNPTKNRKLAVPIPIYKLHPWGFVRKISFPEESECWIWTGDLSCKGYGRFCIDKNNYLAHRVAYVLKHGEPAPDLVIDHLCRNRACVNPDHLEAVSIEENIERGDAPALLAEATLIRSTRTHCKNGHPFSGENLSLRDPRQRICKTCRRETTRKLRERRRIAEGRPPEGDQRSVNERLLTKELGLTD